MSFRLPYIRCCMASVVSTPCLRLYSAQDSRCSGLESTITPSISKRNARILFKIEPRIGAKFELRIEPCQIVRRPGNDGQRENLGQFVGMRGFKHGGERVIAF